MNATNSSPNLGNGTMVKEDQIIKFKGHYLDNFINIADFLAEEFHKNCDRLLSNCGFVVCTICTSYIESIYQIKNFISTDLKECDKAIARCTSKSAFQLSFKELLPFSNIPDDAIDSIYSDLRCGLVHNFMTRRDIVIDRSYHCPVGLYDGCIYINPKLLVGVIKDDFTKYIESLKNNCSPFADNFNKYHDYLSTKASLSTQNSTGTTPYR